MLLFIKLGFFDILDILIVAFIFYQIYRLVKGTVAINIFAVIFTFFVAWLLVRALSWELPTECSHLILAMRAMDATRGRLSSTSFTACESIRMPRCSRYLSTTARLRLRAAPIRLRRRRCSCAPRATPRWSFTVWLASRIVSDHGVLDTRAFLVATVYRI